MADKAFQVPVVDFSMWQGGNDSAASHDFAQALVTTLKKYGAAVLRNHGISLQQVCVCANSQTHLIIQFLFTTSLNFPAAVKWLILGELCSI